MENEGAPSTTGPVPAAAVLRAPLRRCCECLAFVAAWMALGWLGRLDANAYLLTGVPLVVVFQRYVRREPLVRLWVRDAQSFTLGKAEVAVGIILIAVPTWQFVQALSSRNWVILLWLLCCMGGALGAAFALGRLRRHTVGWRVAVSWMAAVLLGGSQMAAAAHANGRSAFVSVAQLPAVLEQFLLYFSVCFVLEEVAFRGALDSHVVQPPVRGAAAWGSACFVSAIWGLWHLPVVPLSGQASLPALGGLLAVQHTLIGIPLSFCWRRSGNLVFPAAAHALLDAYRNAVLLS